MIKVIFFDVDGTLLSHTQKIVPESTKIALNKLSDKGIKRVVATGRHMIELSQLPVNQIKFDGYITLNGQLCLDMSGAVISENPIIGEDKERIIELFHEKSIPVMLIEKDAMYINFINQHVESAQRAISTPLPDTGSYTGNEIYQAIIYGDKGIDEIIDNRLPHCTAARWNDYAVDVISSSGGKIAGIKNYLKMNHLTQEETMAFGDGENDIEMLRYVQTGIAMGNAGKSVKENADYITGEVDHNGIIEALLKLNIIE